MKLVIYYKLSTRSKRSFKRLKTKRGSFHNYQPRIDLVMRLAYELGMNKEQVYEKIQEERDYMLRNLYGERYLSIALR